MAIWSRFIGSAGSQALGFAFGVAASPALVPAVQFLENEAWKLHPDKPPDVMLLAEGVAQGVVDPASAAEWAAEQGYGDAQWAAYLAAAVAAPSIGEIDRMLNRATISRDDFNAALTKHKIPAKWHDALYDLTHSKLDPVQLANAIHRGLIADPGLLAVEPPSGAGNVPAYPVYGVNALDEAQAAGLDKERLGVLVGLMGLPMGVREAAEAVFRGILTRTDYERAVAEGNTRNEWQDAIFESSRQIPTARDFIENALRGYRTLAEAQAGAALHGMSAEHARLIFQNSGRPLNLHQITQALAWGAKYNPLPGDDPDPYMNSVLIGAVTPAYYEMQDTLKYTLPSAFFLRVLQQQGVLTEDEATTWYKRMGWHPDLAAKVAHAFAASTTTATADPHVSKAQTQLWTKAHTAYVNGRIDATQASTALGKAGVDPAAIADVLAVWDAEAALVRSGPSKSDIRKQYREGTLTVDAAVAELTDLGWNPTQAQAYLVE